MSKDSIETIQPDLSDLTLDEVMRLDSPALQDVLKRILEDADAAGGIVAGFQSAI